MHRLLASGIAAAALTTAALVALPQAAFADQTVPGGGGSIPVAALVAPQADPAVAPAPRVPASVPRAAKEGPAERSTPPAQHRTATSPTPSKAAPATTAPATTAAAKAAPAKAAPATTGADISYPQCAVTPPSNQLFGVIGVNGGTAKDFNPCLAKQFAWAATTLGGTAQDRASLYINTANPAGQGSWWPASATDRPSVDPTVAGPTTALPTDPVTYPDGTAVPCAGEPQAASCAYVYGYVRALQAIEYAKEALGPSYSGTLRWWLDTETSNTWAGSTTANAASLAGAATALARASSDATARVGVYSTTAQYGTIVGGTGSAVPNLPDGERSPLVGLPEWGAGASNLKGAQSNCGARPFTGGRITLTQYVSGSFDFDVSCAGY